MPVNLLNEKALNEYIAEQIYHEEQMETFTVTELQDSAFIARKKDSIIRAMIYQWAKKTIRDYLIGDKNMPFLIKVTNTDKASPKWIESALAKGEDVRIFNSEQIPASMRNDVQNVIDYLYNIANQYIDKILEHENPKITLGALKTRPEHKTFTLALQESQKWHRNMARATALKEIEEREKKALLQDTKHIMDFDDGYSIVQLLSPKALDMETKYMGHCAGSGIYDLHVKMGRIKIYSIRDKNYVPHVTIEVIHDHVEQCKGKGNKPVVYKYAHYLKNFINVLKLDPKHELKSMGLCRDVHGNVHERGNIPSGTTFFRLDISNLEFSQLPDFTNVNILGFLDCSRNNISNLIGVPSLASVIDCSYSPDLISLVGVNNVIFLRCTNTSITSLEGCSEGVRTINCSKNRNLTSLNGCGKNVKFIKCSDCNLLTDLRGCGENVTEIKCKRCTSLTSLAGCGDNVEKITCTSCANLTSLAGGGKNLKIIDCSCCASLTSLIGSPDTLTELIARDCKSLKSLEGCSDNVHTIYCNGISSLTNLKGCGANVKKLNLNGCKSLISLEGCPETIEEIDCKNCPKLKYIPSYIPHDKIKGLNTWEITTYKKNWRTLQKKIAPANMHHAILGNVNSL